jgi:hypothetical protein
MPNKIYAVIAGELAESRKVSSDQLGKIPDIIRSSFNSLNNNLPEEKRMAYEIIRMDEFLCISESPESALHSILMLASEFRNRTYTELKIRSDLKLSMGIGPAEMVRKELRESDGTAFRLADSELRKMKRNQRLSICSTDDSMNAEFLVACGFMDIIIHDWSDEQAEAMFLRLSGKNQMEISNDLNISQPAVNRRLKAAHYDAIENFINRYYSLLS